MHRAVEEPLDIDLLLATETEAVQAEAATDIGKDRFDSCHSSTIYKAACYRVDLAPHLLRKGLSIVFCLSGIVSDLARYCLVGVLHALCPESAWHAVCLASHELDEPLSIDQHVAAVPVEPLAGWTHAKSLVRAEREVFRLKDALSPEPFCQLFLELLLVPACFCETGIALPEFIVCHVGVDAFFHNHPHVLFRVEATVRCELGLFKDVFFFADGLEVLTGFLNHGFQELGLRFSERLGVDHDLVLAVDHGDPVVSLDHAVGGFHRGAFIVGDVAFSGFFSAAGLVVVFRQPVPDLFDLFLKGGDILLFFFYNGPVSLCLVRLPMLGDDLIDGFFHLFFFMRQLFLGPAPLLGGVRRELAPVHGEHFLADQAHLVAYEQYFEEELDGLLVLR